MEEYKRVRMNERHDESYDCFLVPHLEFKVDEDSAIFKITGEKTFTISKGLGVEGPGDLFFILMRPKDSGKKVIVKYFEDDSHFKVVE